MRLRYLCLVALLTVFAAACGGGGGAETESETEAATEATEEETATEEASAEESESDAAVAPNTGDGVLAFGTLLPETGSLAFLGPPEIAGVNLAIEDVNAAGGVLGQEVTVSLSDSGDTSTDIASQSVDRLLAEGVDAIIGAASSGVTFTVRDKIEGANVIQFSPANTAKALTQEGDLYFRTAPSDILQGRVLGDLIAADGNASAVMLALDDPYGTGLLEDTVAAFEASGGQVLDQIVYDPQAQTFDAEVQRIVDADPDAVLIIGFDETARILGTMIEQGVGPDAKPVYGSDGNMANTLAAQVDPNNPAVIEGMRGTTPLPAENEAFFARLDEFQPGLEDRSYAAESYDAVIITALAAAVAGTDEPSAVAAEIVGVTSGGEKCVDFAACLALADAGTDLDYDGASGPLEFTEAGEPGAGNYGILEFGADGTYTVTDNVEAAF